MATRLVHRLGDRIRPSLHLRVPVTAAAVQRSAAGEPDHTCSADGRKMDDWIALD